MVVVDGSLAFWWLLRPVPKVADCCVLSSQAEPILALVQTNGTMGHLKINVISLLVQTNDGTSMGCLKIDIIKR